MAENADLMAKRHKQELRDLDGKVRALLKTAKKSNRATVEAEAIRMGYELKARQTEESDLLSGDEAHDLVASDGSSTLHDDKVELAGLTLADTAEESRIRDDQETILAKKAKAQKKKDKKVSKDTERQLLKEEIHSTSGPSLREVELDRINSLLLEQDLTVKLVASDGHCLYRAIADQLSNLWLHDPGSKGCGDEGSESAPHDFVGLRTLAANYLRAHGEEFAPFLGMTSTDSEYFTHCDKVESVLGAEWGGQLEIMALCSSLRRRIIVYSADAPALVMGLDIPDIDSRIPLKVAYHRHFYALGEHYNSVAPIVKPCACCLEKTDS